MKTNAAQHKRSFADNQMDCAQCYRRLGSPFEVKVIARMIGRAVEQMQ